MLEKVPLQQVVQLAAPVDENVPPAQLSHTELPSSDRLPASHAVQVSAPVLENVPLQQVAQLASPAEE